jgi:hypothetical protein
MRSAYDIATDSQIILDRVKDRLQTLVEFGDCSDCQIYFFAEQFDRMLDNLCNEEFFGADGFYDDPRGNPDNLPKNWSVLTGLDPERDSL